MAGLDAAMTRRLAASGHFGGCKLGRSFVRIAAGCEPIPGAHRAGDDGFELLAARAVTRLHRKALDDGGVVAGHAVELSIRGDEVSFGDAACQPVPDFGALRTASIGEEFPYRVIFDRTRRCREDQHAAMRQAGESNDIRRGPEHGVYGVPRWPLLA